MPLCRRLNGLKSQPKLTILPSKSGGIRGTTDTQRGENESIRQKPRINVNKPRIGAFRKNTQPVLLLVRYNIFVAGKTRLVLD